MKKATNSLDTEESWPRSSRRQFSARKFTKGGTAVGSVQTDSRREVAVGRTVWGEMEEARQDRKEAALAEVREPGWPARRQERQVRRPRRGCRKPTKPSTSFWRQ